MTTHVALIRDSAGQYAHVYGTARTFGYFACQLEDIGCEVIEDQTEDWSDSLPEEIAEDCMSIHQLLQHEAFTPHI